MFTFTVKMSLQMFYSNIMAHMPSAYGLGKNTIFNKVQFSSVQYKSCLLRFMTVLSDLVVTISYVYCIL